MTDSRKNGRRLSIERYEERRMLTTADIVFLFDESGSQTMATEDWLGNQLVPTLDAALVPASQGELVHA